LIPILRDGLRTAFASNVPYRLEMHTQGDVPTRTGHWDIADFLRLATNDRPGI
jgi:hypothetical protein